MFAHDLHTIALRPLGCVLLIVCSSEEICKKSRIVPFNEIIVIIIIIIIIIIIFNTIQKSSLCTQVTWTSQWRWSVPCVCWMEQCWCCVQWVGFRARRSQSIVRWSAIVCPVWPSSTNWTDRELTPTGFWSSWGEWCFYVFVCLGSGNRWHHSWYAFILLVLSSCEHVSLFCTYFVWRFLGSAFCWLSCMMQICGFSILRDIWQREFFPQS